LPASVPDARIRAANPAPLRPDGEYVLYWMNSARRLGWNFALDRAVGEARRLGRPLLIFEGLRVGYRWANQRHHRFALDGMAEHRIRLEGTGVGYHPWVEGEEGEGKGLLEALASRAALVVTDEFPTFFLPRMVAAAARRLPVRLEVVDSCGLLPLSAAGSPFGTAYAFRRFLQRTLPGELGSFPSSDPIFRGGGLPPCPELPGSVTDRWPAASRGVLEGSQGALDRIPVDRSVTPVPYRGGTVAARDRLARFLADGLSRYAEERNHPDADAGSRLSPWLHWGHLSPHEVFQGVVEKEEWEPGRLGTGVAGKREGWWGMEPASEAFLDELITWREIGFVTAYRDPDHTRYESLPQWARDTLADHREDPRRYRYTLEEFRSAATHDPLWNAAQRQLLEEGRIHNYLRMLWGKKILEWSGSPEEALETMVELNNRYATDGRDPNSWSGIFWVLGRYDRGWPERPIYGKVRSMSSDSTRRKVRLDRYLERWGS